MSHVEDTDTVFRVKRCGLHHKTASLRNRHEESGDIRICHGHRTAGCYLAAEARYDRTVGAQYITEACRDELGLARSLPGLDGQTKALHIYLGQTLGAPHDIGRVDGLVRGDHDHLLHPVLNALVSYISRTDHIDKHGLARILLHQGDMLVGSGMEDDLRMVCPEREIKPRLKPHITYHRHEIQIRKLGLKFKAQIVHRGLGIVIEDKLLYAEAGQLTAQFRTDGAGRTGHHHHLVLELGLDHVKGNLYLVPSKKILNLNFTDVYTALHSTGPHLIYGRDNQHLDTGTDAKADQLVLLALHIILGSEYHTSEGK